MKEFVCIICPNSCPLRVDDEGNVTGAKCERGVRFAKEEMTCPKRTVCSTVATIFEDFPVLPVRTSQEIPKEKVGELMKLLNGICVRQRFKRGEVLVSHLFGTEADLISTSDMTYAYFDGGEAIDDDSGRG